MSSQPMEYEITAYTVSHGVSEAHCADETIRFDSSAMPASELPGPAELLAAAFAACVLKNVERFAGMLPFRYDSASITVRAKRQQTPPRFTEIRYELALVTDEPPDRVDLLHRNNRQAGNGLQHAGGKLRRLWQRPRDGSRVAGNLSEACASAGGCERGGARSLLAANSVCARRVRPGLVCALG